MARDFSPGFQSGVNRFQFLMGGPTLQGRVSGKEKPGTISSIETRLLVVVIASPLKVTLQSPQRGQYAHNLGNVGM